MRSSSNLSEYISDFYQYLTGPGGLNEHSRTNYISWLKFLDEQGYALSDLKSNEDIDDLIQKEDQRRTERAIYTTSRDMVNFKSALRKFLVFRESDFLKQQEETILAEVKRIRKDTTIPSTEREAIVKARVGQGLFRQRLINFWKGCSITEFGHYDLLMASHIRPWRKSDNSQRLDVFNGLLLLPNYDKLFDKGYISFDGNGRIIYSRYISESDRRLLGMDEDVHLIKVEDEHKPYLEYHRENCLMS